jgi:hypothetical protein
MAEVIVAASRRKRIAVVLTGLVLGSVIAVTGKHWFFPWLGRYLSEAASPEAEARFSLVMGGMALLFASAGAGLFQRGIRVLRARQYPLPDAFVWKDTAVATGRKACLYGWLHIGGAAWIGACAVYAALLPRLMSH